MATLPPPGWYPDPSGGPTPRWWNGTAWASPPPPSQPAASPSTALQGAAGGPNIGTLLICGGVLVASIIAATSGGVGAFFSTLGLAGVVVGIVALARGGIRSLALRGRPAALAALGSGFVVMMIGAGMTAAITPTPQPQSDVQQFVETEEPASGTANSPSPSASPRVAVATSSVEEAEAIPFGSVSVNDPNMAAGTSAVTTAGVNGVLIVTYTVTTRDGVETARVRTAERVSVSPVDQVTSVGTYVAPVAAPPPPASSGCDPNYSGCVPIASDVDCAGGSGNGPAYLSGTVNVIGSDIYDLDRDGDGVACE